MEQNKLPEKVLYNIEETALKKHNIQENEYKIIAVFDTDKQIVKNPKFEKVGIVFKIEYQYST